MKSSSLIGNVFENVGFFRLQGVEGVNLERGRMER